MNRAELSIGRGVPWSVTVQCSVTILLNRKMSGTRFPLVVHVEGLQPRYEIAKDPDTRNGFFRDDSLFHDGLDAFRPTQPCQHVDGGWAGRGASCLSWSGEAFLKGPLRVPGFFAILYMLQIWHVIAPVKSETYRGMGRAPCTSMALIYLHTTRSHNIMVCRRPNRKILNAAVDVTRV